MNNWGIGKKGDDGGEPDEKLIASANLDRVMRLTEKLREAFNAFLQEEAIPFTDALMAVHNFHKHIVLECEELSETPMTADMRRIYRRAVVDTLAKALERAPR